MSARACSACLFQESVLGANHLAGMWPARASRKVVDKPWADGGADWQSNTVRFARFVAPRAQRVLAPS
jgi:hypothetical protein